MPDLSGVTVEPEIFRPRRVRVVGRTVAIMLPALALFGWLALPGHIRALFTMSQIITLLLLLSVLVAGVLAIANSYVAVDDAGIRFRNGFRSHRLAWDQIHKFLLRPGDPWAFVLVKPIDRDFEVDLDAEKYMLMGIQAHDGQLAQDAVGRLRIHQQSAAT